MSAGTNNAVTLLARMLTGISTTAQRVDADAPDFAGDFEEAGEHTVKMILELPSGDTYRVTVEWLGAESP